MVGPIVLTSIDLGTVLELELELELEFLVVVAIQDIVERAAMSLYSIQCVVYSDITVYCHFMVILHPVYSLRSVYSLPSTVYSPQSLYGPQYLYGHGLTSTVWVDPRSHIQEQSEPQNGQQTDKARQHKSTKVHPLSWL
jgi:hypothetical protein